MHIHDLIGIGFGPSNIALAIALQEERQAGHRPIDAFFIEKQAGFSWHPGMLLGHAHMQISYLKDLATLRNPRSRFSFAMYLKEKGRMFDFGLLGRPASRHEWSDYVGWVAGQVRDYVTYAHRVTEVLPVVQDTGLRARIIAGSSFGATSPVARVSGTIRTPFA